MCLCMRQCVLKHTDVFLVLSPDGLETVTPREQGKHLAPGGAGFGGAGF